MSSPKYPDVTVKLAGSDGNAFAIIGSVAEALRKAGLREAADAFRREAYDSNSYGDLLQLAMRTVDVS